MRVIIMRVNQIVMNYMKQSEALSMKSDSSCK